MLKLTLLSVSLLTVFGSAAIAPALSEIALSFPHIPATQIKSLLTAPALAMVFIAPFIGKLSHKFGQRRLLILGLFFYIVGGLGGSVTMSFEALFASRVLLGAGIGILMPMASGFIAEFYSGKERLQLMGWSSSATNFFGIISNMLVGFLALYNWRYGLSIYSVALLSLILVYLFIPKQDSPKKLQQKRVKLTTSAYLWALFMFLFMVGIYALPVNIALYIKESQLGGSREAGIAMSCLSISAIIAGLLGLRARDLFRRYFLIAALSFISIGYLLLTNAPSMVTIPLSMLIIGIGSGLIMPYISYGATSSVPQGGAMGAMGMIATAASLGQFATPLILDGIAHLLGYYSTHFVLSIAALSFTVTTALLALIALLTRPAKSNYGSE